MQPTHPEGYLALPTTGTGTPVLVLHAWWGLNDTIKALCQQLADAGFVAFAPDLYQGKVATTIPDATLLSKELSADPRAAYAAIAEALAFLKPYAETGKGIAVLGFSLGAYFAMELSGTAPDLIRSVVIFYGTFDGDLSQSNADYLLHFAENDEYEPQEYVEATEQAIQAAGRPVTLYQYPDTGHWFFEPDRPDAYNANAAALAWQRTLAFLQRESD